MTGNIWKSYACTAVKKWDISDPRSHEHYWTGSWNETWKKFRPVRDLNQVVNNDFDPHSYESYTSLVLHVHSCEDRLYLISSPQCTLKIFIYFQSLFTTWKVYLDPTLWPAPRWLVSSVGRTLHRYCRAHGFKSRTGLNFFRSHFSYKFSSVHSCEDRVHLISSPQCRHMIFIYFQSLFTTWKVSLGPTLWLAPSWLVSSVGKALHRYRRSHGVQIPYGPEFF